MAKRASQQAVEVEVKKTKTTEPEDLVASSEELKELEKKTPRDKFLALMPKEITSAELGEVAERVLSEWSKFDLTDSIGIQLICAKLAGPLMLAAREAMLSETSLSDFLDRLLVASGATPALVARFNKVDAALKISNWGKRMEALEAVCTPDDVTLFTEHYIRMVFYQSLRSSERNVLYNKFGANFMSWSMPDVIEYQTDCQGEVKKLYQNGAAVRKEAAKSATAEKSKTPNKGDAANNKPTPKSDRSDKTCIGCGLRGHYRRDCTTRCMHCREIGHRQFRCPNKQMMSGGGGGGMYGGGTPVGPVGGYMNGNNGPPMNDSFSGASPYVSGMQNQYRTPQHQPNFF